MRELEIAWRKHTRKYIGLTEIVADVAGRRGGGRGGIGNFKYKIIIVFVRDFVRVDFLFSLRQLTIVC